MKTQQFKSANNKGGNSSQRQDNEDISSTLLQEIQNLKDKFKSEDEVYEKGIIILIFTS